MLCCSYFNAAQRLLWFIYTIVESSEASHYSGGSQGVTVSLKRFGPSFPPPDNAYDLVATLYYEVRSD